MKLRKYKKQMKAFTRQKLITIKLSIVTIKTKKVMN